MKVVYLSQFRDSSGYASAARGYLKAFDNYLTAHPGEFELKVHTLVVEHSSCLNTEERKLLEKYEFSSDSEIEQFVKGKYLLIWHQPPPMLPNFINMYGETDQYWAAARKLIENATKNINLTVWEADKAPEFWNKVYDMYDYSKYGDFKNKINPSEVLTMSVETFADVENMQTLIQKHPDLFELVVGMSRAGNL